MSDVEQCGHSGTKPHSRQSTKEANPRRLSSKTAFSPRSYTPMQRLDERLGEHGARPPLNSAAMSTTLHVGKGLATWPFAERDSLPRTLAANAAAHDASVSMPGVAEPSTSVAPRMRASS